MNECVEQENQGQMWMNERPRNDTYSARPCLLHHYRAHYTLSACRYRLVGSVIK